MSAALIAETVGYTATTAETMLLKEVQKFEDDADAIFEKMATPQSCNIEDIRSELKKLRPKSDSECPVPWALRDLQDRYKDTMSKRIEWNDALTNYGGLELMWHHGEGEAFSFKIDLDNLPCGEVREGQIEYLLSKDLRFKPSSPVENRWNSLLRKLEEGCAMYGVHKIKQTINAEKDIFQLVADLIVTDSPKQVFGASDALRAKWKEIPVEQVKRIANSLRCHLSKFEAIKKNLPEERRSLKMPTASSSDKAFTLEKLTMTAFVLEPLWCVARIGNSTAEWTNMNVADYDIKFLKLTKSWMAQATQSLADNRKTLDSFLKLTSCTPLWDKIVALTVDRVDRYMKLAKTSVGTALSTVSITAYKTIQPRPTYEETFMQALKEDSLDKLLTLQTDDRNLHDLHENMLVPSRVAKVVAQMPGADTVEKMFAGTLTTYNSARDAVRKEIQFHEGAKAYVGSLKPAMKKKDDGKPVAPPTRTEAIAQFWSGVKKWELGFSDEHKVFLESKQQP